MALPNEGSGTSGDPYILTTVDHVNSINTDDTAFYEFGNDIDFQGGDLERFHINGGIDMKGYSLLNIGDFVSGGAGVLVGIDDIGGYLRNGHIDVSINFSSSNMQAIIDRPTGTVENMKFTGTLENGGTGGASPINILGGGANIRNIISLVEVRVAGEGNGFCNTVQAINDFSHCIVTGQLVDISGTGSATLYGFSGTDFQQNWMSNCFWNSTLNPSATDPTSATPKTTSELQNFDTYTDTATTGLDTVYDMVLQNNHDGDQATALWFIDNGNNYPELYFEYDVVVVDTYISGTVELNSSLTQNCKVMIHSYTANNFSDLALVETQNTNANGEFTSSVVYDDTKRYIVTPVYFLEDVTGTADSGGTNTLTHTGNFTAGDYDGGDYIVRITNGTGSGQEFKINSNTADTLTIAANWDTEPDATSVYSVYEVYSDQSMYVPRGSTVE